MQRLFFILCVILIYPLFAQNHSTYWKLAKSKDGINISYRWIHLTKESKVREMKTEFLVNSDVNNLVKLFTNSSQLKKWQTSVEECDISNFKQSEWLTYLSFDLPWPLKSKDVVMKNELLTSKTSTSILMKSVPEAKPLYKNKNRIKSLESEWKFIPQKSGKTKVIYTTLTYDKPEFPRSITDPIIQNNLIESIVLLKKYAS